MFETLFTTEFLMALMMIIAIDILLGGDNAVVIAMASRKLPNDQKKKAILWGTFFAIIVRVIATVAAAYLLKIPYLFLVGGLILVWIAYKLLVDDDDHQEIKAGSTLSAAIRTIIIADLMMGLDNVLAIAGTAKGDMLLIILGLLISIPVMIWGSHLILKAMERYTWIPFVGAAILAYAAASMITHEQYIKHIFTAYPWSVYAIQILIVGGVVTLGFWQRNRMEAKKAQDELKSPSKENVGFGS